MQREKI